MTVQVLAWGCTSVSEFAVSRVGTVHALSSSADFEADFFVTLHRTVALAPVFDFTSDGASGAPWPGIAIYSQDTVEPILMDFGLGLSGLGSFVFPADADGVAEAPIADGGRGPLQGMAFQDPSSVAIDGGVIRNVTFVDISIDGGSF